MNGMDRETFQRTFAGDAGARMEGGGGPTRADGTASGPEKTPAEHLVEGEDLLDRLLYHSETHHDGPTTWSAAPTSLVVATKTPMDDVSDTDTVLARMLTEEGAHTRRRSIEAGAYDVDPAGMLVMVRKKGTTA